MCVAAIGLKDVAALQLAQPSLGKMAVKEASTAILVLKGVDAGLNKIGGRDPPRHRRSRASPL